MPFGIPTERSILKHVFLKQVYTPPSPLYLALHDAEYNELTDQPNYARVGPINPNDFASASGGEIANVTILAFPKVTSNWTRTAAYYALWESLEPAELPFLMAPLDTVYTAKVGEIPTFGVGAIKVKMADLAMSLAYGVGGHNAFSNYMKDKLLDHAFGKATYTPPDIWVGLLQYDPGDELINTECYEIAWAGGYYRTPAIPAAWSNFMATMWNNVKICFSEATGFWGTVRHFGLFDVDSPLSEGHALFHGPMEPKVVNIGIEPFFEITVPGGGTGEYDKLGIGLAIL